MTLSAVAYSSFDSIVDLQDNLNSVEALEQEYDALWLFKDVSNLMFVVKNKMTDDYAIAIRGPVFRFDLPLFFNIYETLGITSQVPLPHGKLGNARIAGGILDTLTDMNNASYKGRSLNKLAKSLPAHAKVYITGHSLGGSFANALAANLAGDNSLQLDIIPYTFGAPTTGNKSFAELFNPDSGTYLFSQSSRCINFWDIMPYAWQDLQGIPSIDYRNVRCPIDLTMCVDCIARLLILSRVSYAQPPMNLQLQGDIEPNDSFFQEAMFQHQHNTYLSLLGLNPVRSSAYSYKQRKEGVLAESL